MLVELFYSARLKRPREQLSLGEKKKKKQTKNPQVLWLQSNGLDQESPTPTPNLRSNAH